MNYCLKKLKSFDLVVISFCIATGIFMLFGYRQLQNISIHLILRIALLTLIFLLVKVEDSKNLLLQFFRNFYPLLFLGFFYSETDYYNNFLFENLDIFLVHIENKIIGTQLALEFSKQIPFPWFSEIMHFGYFSYYVMTLGIPLLFYIKARRHFEKAMFIIILSFCFYYILFILLPSIGPQFYFPLNQQSVPEGYLFSKMMNIIIELAETQTGAFPSSHVGLAMIYILLAVKYFKRVLFFLMPLTVILVFSTVYLKAHYTIDIIAGAITGILFYYLSVKIYFKFFESLDK
ncbi:MAG TPA: phosphoesterase [Bacteroidales bacterium]|nr:phosphoesterase [Bacteroidales bacterium]